MGNRAVITTRQKKIGVYLHWYGGRDSVQGFLSYCKLKGYRCPENDDYGWARLCQVIGNFFGGDLCVGINKYENLDIDNGDNGVYVIENWEIVDRLYHTGSEQNEYSLLEMLEWINESMPEKERLSQNELEGFVESEVMPKCNDLVEITCYGRTEVLERSKALDKYFECMMCSEGSERDRYTNIYIDLKTGKKRCTDEQ